MAVRAHRSEVTNGTDDIGPSGHASAFEVKIAHGDDRSPEQWARAAFEETPTHVRSFVKFGWRYVVGLRLGPQSSPNHVAGWTVRAVRPGVINLTVESWLVTATKDVEVTNDTVRIVTVVRYKHRLGRIVWTLITPVHYLTEPYLLGYAASHRP
jgi:Protein of unknown function (DUF2867)